MKSSKQKCAELASKQVFFFFKKLTTANCEVAYKHFEKSMQIRCFSMVFHFSNSMFFALSLWGKKFITPQIVEKRELWCPSGGQDVWENHKQRKRKIQGRRSSGLMQSAVINACLFYERIISEPVHTGKVCADSLCIYCAYEQMMKNIFISL